MDDVLSDVFRLVRLRGCVYFLRDFHAPWAMSVGDFSVAQFHIVVRGQCIVEVDDGVHHLETGDVLLFPHGHPHVLADQEGREPVPGREVMRAIADREPLFVTGPGVTRLLCGHFEYHQDVRHPLLTELPGFIHLNSFDAIAPGYLQSIVPLLMQEVGSRQPGSEIVAERLAEALLIQVIRAYVTQQDDLTGVLAALRDVRLIRVLKLVHTRFEEKLTLEDMARTAAMSRSAFSLLFSSVVKTTPIAYLTKWRMCRAQELLKTNQYPISEIAERVGYESDVAFSRAFLREYQRTPSMLRKDAQLGLRSPAP